MKKLFLLYFLSFALFAAASELQEETVSSRPSGPSIGGQITDRISGESLPGAWVVLYEAATGQVVRRSACDDQGYYTFDRLPEGTYRIEAGLSGYRPARSQAVEVSAPVSLSLALEPEYRLLSDVVVTPRVSSVRTRLGQRTVYVGGDLQTSGNASKDLMNNLPSACTDLKGSMTLRGSSNVRYFIDGRPTNVNSMELLNLLPASSVARVEFITSPSAKEYPDGPSGIVNIVTTKSRKQGFGASVDAGVGTGEKYDLALNVNRRWEKVNIWGAYTFFQNKSVITGEVSKTDIPSSPEQGDPATSAQQVGGYYLGRLHEVKAGVDYDLSSRTQLSYSAAYRNAWRASKMDIDSRSFAAASDAEPSSAYSSAAYSASRMDFFTTGAHLSHAFDNSSRLEADVNYEIDHTGADTEFAQDFTVKASPFMPDGVVDTSHYRNDYSYFSARVDYTYQRDRYKWEAGVSANLRTMDNPYHDRSISRMPSPIPPLETLTTSHFQFDEDVYALYLTYSRTFGALTASAGLRGEYWKSQVRSLLQEDGTGGYRHLNDSLNVFPSASLIWRVDRDRSLMLSYSSRVARPDTRQLNPNAVSTNPARPSVGNPFLRPEYNHSLELTFHGVWDELDVSLSAYYNYNQNVIQSYLTPIHPVTGEQTRGVLYNTYKNYGSSYFLGTELIASLQLWDRLDLSGSLNAYYADYSRGENTFWNASGINFTAKMSANFQVNDHLTAMLLGRYSGRQTLIQGTVDPLGTMDAGLRYSLLEGRMNLFVRLTDVFNSFRSTTRSVVDAGDGLLQNEVSREGYRSRVLYFTASYSF